MDQTANELICTGIALYFTVSGSKSTFLDLPRMAYNQLLFVYSCCLASVQLLRSSAGFFQCIAPLLISLLHSQRPLGDSMCY